MMIQMWTYVAQSLTVLLLLTLLGSLVGGYWRTQRGNDRNGR